MTPVFLACAWTYATWLGARFDRFAIPALVMALAGFLVARYILKVRRQRGQVVTAVGAGILLSPWPVFLLIVPR
jgi:hypothetical protein